MVHPFEMKWYTSVARYLYSLCSRVKQVEEAAKIPAPVDISGAITCRLLGGHDWDKDRKDLYCTCNRCGIVYWQEVTKGVTYSAQRANNLAGPK